MAGNFWRAKDTLYFFLAALFLIGGLVGILVGVSYSFGWPRYDPGVLPILGALCTITGIVPGVLFLLLGFRARRSERELVEFAAWVKAYRRIGLGELSGKLGKNRYDAEKILVQVVDRGLVKGFIDRQTDEFVLQEAVGQEYFIERCPRCAANIQRRYFAGETVLCPYCRSVIVTPETHVA